MTTLGTPKGAPSETGELLFDLQGIKADVSFYLKHERGIPKVVVDHILAQLSRIAHDDNRDDHTPSGILEATRVFLANRTSFSSNSPGYLAFVEYIKVRGYGSIPPETSQIFAGDAVTQKTQQALIGAAFPDEANTVTRGKLPDIMSMSFEDVVLSFFPSISQLLLPALRLKMMSEQADNENPRWHVNYILELMAKFPVMQRDLDASGISYVNAANTILARAQQETSQSIAARAGRGRGETNSVSAAQESGIQAASPLTPGDSLPASERITLENIGETAADVHERATVNPGDITADVQARSEAITLPGADAK